MLTVGGLLATGCGFANSGESSPLREPTTVTPRERLFREVDELSPSLIKDLLIKRALPYYEKEPPFDSFEINRSGLTFKVHSADIDSTTHNRELFIATLSIRSKDFQGLEGYKLLSDVRIRVPLIGMVLENERRLFPPENLASDGTPFMVKVYSAGDTMWDGVFPKIKIIKPDANVVKPANKEFWDAMEKYAYIKELCSLLAYDLQLEETYRKMLDMGSETYLEVEDKNGSRVKVEIVTQLITSIDGREGRWKAIMDLAGYMLGLKALEGTSIATVLSRQPSIKAAQESIGTLDLGNNEGVLMANTRRWILSSPEARKLVHAGNLQEIP